MEQNENKKAIVEEIEVSVTVSENFCSLTLKAKAGTKGLTGKEIDEQYNKLTKYLADKAKKDISMVVVESNQDKTPTTPSATGASAAATTSDIDSMSLEEIEKLSITGCKSSSGKPVMTLKDREEILGNCTAKELAYLGGGIYITTKYNEETEEVTKIQNDPSQVMTSAKSAHLIKMRQAAKKLYLARLNAKVKGYKDIQWVA